MASTAAPIPSQITTKQHHANPASKITNATSTMDSKHSDDSSDDHTEVLSLTSSSDLSSSSANARTSFPPNSCTNFPSYFLCPITRSVMTDPVIDREGNTFERDAILRWLVLYECSPLTGNAVKMEELITDRVVKGAIDKARKDAWVRYILDFEKEVHTTAHVRAATPGRHRHSNGQSTDGSHGDLHLSPCASNSPGSPSSAGKGKIFVKRNSEQIAIVDPHRQLSKSFNVARSPPIPSKAASFHGGDKAQVARLPALPIQLEPKNNKKVTPSPPPKPSSSTRVIHNQHNHHHHHPPQQPQPQSRIQPPGPPPPPKTNKRMHSDKSSSSENTPVTASITIPPTHSSNISACSNITFLPHNGWAVQLGVHKIVCSSPGLSVTTDIHRRSTAVQRKYIDINGKISHRDLVLPPGSYVEILETQVHGGRVRGRIAWEEDDDLLPIPKNEKKKRSFLKRKKKKTTPEDESEKKTVLCGWISLQWEEEEDGDSAMRQKESRSKQGISNQDHRITDEDEGPWTEPIPLGVYRITFSAGLPLRETPERDSMVMDKLERGRCVEVVETQVKGDRVRARCIVPPMPNEEGIVAGGKFQSGWISLLNAMTGASGAQPVPLGAYVAVAESGCVITEGGRLDSKVKGTLTPGSCIEVVATRIEEGVVRGLIAAGGHVTLFVPTGRVDRGGVQREGGRMFAMPVPLGTYQIIQNGVEVTTGISGSSPVSVRLKLDACAEIVETRVEDGRVRGRMSAVGYGGVSKEAKGWINLFEPTCRWAKIVCFQGGRPIAPQG
ncbi:hypothetical protein ACHAWX_005693 [Stephanocyclus meneghinianus]